MSCTWKDNMHTYGKHLSFVIYSCKCFFVLLKGRQMHAFPVRKFLTSKHALCFCYRFCCGCVLFTLLVCVCRDWRPSILATQLDSTTCITWWNLRLKLKLQKDHPVAQMVFFGWQGWTMSAGNWFFHFGSGATMCWMLNKLLNISMQKFNFVCH